MRREIARGSNTRGAARFAGASHDQFSRLLHQKLVHAKERLGKPDAARASYERLIALWKDADPDLVALKEARERLARLGAAVR